MRTAIVSVALVLVSLAAHPAGTSAAAAAPCVTATRACEFSDARRRTRTVDDLPHLFARCAQDRRRALIMVHGTEPQRRSLLRDVHRRRVSRRRARQHRHHRAAPDRSTDKPEPNEIVWANSGDTWRSGGVSRRIRRCRHSTSWMRFSESSRTRRTFRTSRNRRRGALGRRPVRDAVRDVEQGARHARRARSPTSSRTRRAMRGRPRCDRCRRATRIRRRRTRKRLDQPTGRSVAHAVHVRTVRRGEGADLQPLARGLRKPHRLHGEDVGRSAEEAAGRTADDVSARPGRRAAARRIRLVADGDGARTDTARARRSVRQVRHGDARREAHDHSCPSAATTIGASSRPTSCFRRFSRNDAGNSFYKWRKLVCRLSVTPFVKTIPGVIS